MSLNHHVLTKKTTDAILAKFKCGDWKSLNNSGPEFYRTGVSSNFPSPDAGFRCDASDLIISFEFKPPTETKRGILTGLGQSIAYLNSSNISFLIIPNFLEDFDISKFMSSLFDSQIVGHLPVGLISFDVDNPDSVELLHNVDMRNNNVDKSKIGSTRFWAKHQDLPIELFHLILDYYYQHKTKKIHSDAFETCWKEKLFPVSNIDNLVTPPILDIRGKPIKTLAGTKNIDFGSKLIKKIKKKSGVDKTQAQESLKQRTDPATAGDTLYQSIRKNFLSFLKHVQVIDSEGELTDLGFKIYHLGTVHGPTSKIFYDYFTKLVLFTGNQLDVIMDLEDLCNEFRGIKSYVEIQQELEVRYIDKGMIKRNPRRIVGNASNTPFLKYEDLLWRALGITKKLPNAKPEICFNWKKITEISSLPDL
ncbi:hypothetical protein [Salinimonas iocasae]|uniref:Uncharacterized protein n=1 Tax=Salinimonas iocasae TaxID=2572577 RepID=A0A5B7YA28_9ALTE|nr:hypothetical protein [Salinimonas iocasae]QCZ92186.1 hypothetical protein FBQ74_01265 [Salinimonas iocasae]